LNNINIISSIIKSWLFVYIFKIPVNDIHKGLLSNGPNEISNLGFIAKISNIVTLLYKNNLQKNIIIIINV